MTKGVPVLAAWPAVQSHLPCSVMICDMVVHADTGKQLFAAMAAKAAVQGDWLVLPGGACFLGRAWLGSEMYVREAYVKLRNVLDGLLEMGIGHVVVSGNPGLGKSQFAIYSLIRHGTHSERTG